MPDTTETTPAVPMTIEERAREIASNIFQEPNAQGALAYQIAEALRTVRNEALEEAAKVGDEILSDPKASGREIPKAIRSLKESP